jgi:hypothetical protein
MYVPLSAVPYGTDFKPKMMVLGKAVKIVDHHGLIDLANVIQVVQKKIRVAVRQLRQCIEQTLEIDYMPMEEINFGASEFLLSFMFPRAGASSISCTFEC